MNGVEWKIETLSNRRLESEIAAFYWDAAQIAPGTTPSETKVLGALWAEFDKRVASGAMTDDDEAVLDASGRWIG